MSPTGNLDQGARSRSWWMPARLAFAILLGMIVLQMLIYYPQLPAQVASHFDAAGHPNGWSSRSAYLVLHTFIVLVITLCFAALPAWIEGAPARLVNLPNKDYWLAPERRPATMARIASALTWFGCAGLGFVLVITSLVIDVNLGRESALPAVPFLAVLGGIALCTVLLILRLLYVGRSPPS